VPGPVTVKVVALMDAGSIASLRVAVIELFNATFTAPQMGMVAVTVGCGTVQLVQSEQPAINSTSGMNANNQNHFVFSIFLRMAFLLRSFTAHNAKV
jgi:hypothetical protein